MEMKPYESPIKKTSLDVTASDAGLEVRVYDTGSIEWRKDGQLHREGAPAVIMPSIGTEWYINGKLHRDDAPAVEQLNGTQLWYQHGKAHREDGPALSYAGGYREWLVDGKRHREDGPAVEKPNGGKEYWLKGRWVPVMTEKKKPEGPAADFSKVAAELKGEVKKLDTRVTRLEKSRQPKKTGNKPR